MTAGFKIAGEVFWGSNGAIEEYVAALADAAADRLGAADPLAIFLSDERDGFYCGKVVLLDRWLTDTAARQRFREILDAATRQIHTCGTWTADGEAWIATEIARLRSCVLGESPL